MLPSFPAELLARIVLGLVLGGVDAAWTLCATPHPADPWWPTLFVCGGGWTAASLLVAPRQRNRQRHAAALGVVVLCVAALGAIPWQHRMLTPLLAVAALGVASLREISPRIGAACLALALLAWPLRLFPSTPPTGRGEHPHVLWVSIDTFRADGRSGSPEALAPRLTPFLDHLATRGCAVEPAFATSPLTGPSHAAMLSGQHPIDLGILLNGRPLSPETRSVAKEFAGEGYRTEAWVSTAMLDGRLGYARGFHRYDDTLDDFGTARRSALGFFVSDPPRPILQRTGAETLRRFAAEGPVAGPLFAWVHLYDAHRPYTPSPIARDQVPEEPPLPPATAFDTHPVGSPADRGAAAAQVAALRAEVGSSGSSSVASSSVFRDSTTRDATRAYLGEVYEVDRLVERAFAIFEARTGSFPEVWAVVGDHGESLTEHHEHGSHQRHLYRANTQVPLLLSGDCPPAPASTLGLADKLKALAGLAPSTAWPPTVVSAVLGPPHGGQQGPIVPKVMLRQGQREVLVTLPAGKRTIEVYDLARDPHERFPLPHDPQLLAEVEPWVQRLEGRSFETAEDELAEALEALGYAQ